MHKLLANLQKTEQRNVQTCGKHVTSNLQTMLQTCGKLVKNETKAFSCAESKDQTGEKDLLQEKFCVISQLCKG